MGPAGHRNTAHTRQLRHLQVVLGIAQHNGLRSIEAGFFQQLLQHQRVRLGPGLICAARRNKPITNIKSAQAPIQAAPTFTGGNRQLMPLRS